jgi:hypothetical protein
MNANAVRIAGALWWYYASKLLEMLGVWNICNNLNRLKGIVSL